MWPARNASLANAIGRVKILGFLRKVRAIGRVIRRVRRNPNGCVAIEKFTGVPRSIVVPEGAWMSERIYWECPCCDWRVDDCQYLSIVFDPNCPGCGVKKYSDFHQVVEDDQ